MILPLFIVSYLYFIEKESWKSISLYSWAYFVMAGLYFLFRLKFFSLHRSIEGTTTMLPNLSAYIVTQVDLLGWYFSKLLFTQDIIFLWSSTVNAHYAWVTLLAVIGVIAAFYYLIVIFYFIIRFFSAGCAISFTGCVIPSFLFSA